MLRLRCYDASQEIVGCYVCLIFPEYRPAIDNYYNAFVILERPTFSRLSWSTAVVYW